MFLKVVAFLLKKKKKRPKKISTIVWLNIFLQLFIFNIMYIVLVQSRVPFWANQWGTSDWVKYGNIWIFWYVLGFCPYTWKYGSEKTFYLYILCSFLLSLLVNLGTTFFSNALAKFCAWSATLAELTSCSAFFLAAASNSVHLW